MYTAAGISAFDGPLNANMDSGIFLEIEKKIHQHYCPGQPYPCAALSQGSVARTAFEPSVAKQILQDMVAAEPNLTLKYHTQVIEVIKSEKRVTGLKIKDSSGVISEINSKVLIDATEYGDVIKLAGAAYRIGRECYSETQEPHALGGYLSNEPCYPSSDPRKNFVQPITYAIPLKRFDFPQSIRQPLDYDANKYETAWDYSDKYNPSGKWIYAWEPTTTDWKNGFIQYGWIPDSSRSNPTDGLNSFFLNYPSLGNDFAESSYLEATSAGRQSIFQSAKNHSLGYLYFLKQKVPEAANWGIDSSEFDTIDNLPLIPYIRESRRLEAVEMVSELDFSKELNPTRGRFKSNSIAVGDYPMDLHAVQNDPLRHNSGGHDPSSVGVDTSPFQIPYGVLVPKEVDGLLAAEKNIGATHIANGATRLQPTVTAFSQAAGAAAALSIKYGVEPRNLYVPLLQETILDNNLMINYLDNVSSQDSSFKEVQILAMNQKYSGLDVKPSDLTSRAELARWIVQLFGIPINVSGGPHFADVPKGYFGYAEIETLVNKNLIGYFPNCGAGYFCPTGTATKATLAAILAHYKGLNIVDTSPPTFSDVPATHWAYREIEADVKAGIIAQNKGLFYPGSGLKHSQMAEMIYDAGFNFHLRIYKMATKKTAVPSDEIQYILVYKNGHVDSPGVRLEDIVPQTTQYVLASPPPSNFDGSKLIWNIGTAAANAEGMISFIAKVL